MAFPKSPRAHNVETTSKSKSLVFGENFNFELIRSIDVRSTLSTPSKYLLLLRRQLYEFKKHSSRRHNTLFQCLFDAWIDLTSKIDVFCQARFTMVAIWVKCYLRNVISTMCIIWWNGDCYQQIYSFLNMCYWFKQLFYLFVKNFSLHIIDLLTDQVNLDLVTLYC